MDGEYFWVVLLVFYLIFQILGGRKKQKQRRRPDAAKQRRADAPGTRPRPTAKHKPRDPELDDALQEIRRALGFPEPTEHVPAPAPEAESREGRELEVSTAPSAAEHRVDVDRSPLASKPTSLTTERPAEHTAPAGMDGGIRRVTKITMPGRDRGSDTGSDARSRLKSRESLEVAKRPSSQRMDSAFVRKRLSRANSLREVFLLKEVLDRPRSIRRHR